MKTRSISFLFLFFPFLLIPGPLLPGQSSLLTASQHIQNLKEGILLVRLNTFQNKIDIMREAGMQKKAEELELTQRFKNIELIRSFEAEFDFCPVYYFLSSDAHQIREKELSEIVVGEQMKKLDIVPGQQEGKVYIAAFANVEIDTEFNKTAESKLVIMDRSFDQLSAPFPFYEDFYYKRTIFHSFLTFFNFNLKKRKTKERQSVYKLNQSLHKFYNKHY